MAGRAPKALPAELMAMARDGMDMILLQECGLHETGSPAFRELVADFACKHEFQSLGPWEIHHSQAYCTLVSRRRITRARAAINFVWPPLTSWEDPQWNKKRPRT